MFYSKAELKKRYERSDEKEWERNGERERGKERVREGKRGREMWLDKRLL